MHERVRPARGVCLPLTDRGQRQVGAPRVPACRRPFRLPVSQEEKLVLVHAREYSRSARRLLVSNMGAMPTETSTYTMWRKLAGVPGGRRLFSTAVALRAPYFLTVLPTVRELRPGRAEVSSPKWWGVHNHIGTFHAIAACNLAEVAMGMLAEATVPSTHRWIPKGMTTSYVAKAGTSLTAVAELPEPPEFGDEGVEVEVPVAVSDKRGKVVVSATITIWVTPRAT